MQRLLVLINELLDFLTIARDALIDVELRFLCQELVDYYSASKVPLFFSRLFFEVHHFNIEFQVVQVVVTLMLKEVLELEEPVRVVDNFDQERVELSGAFRCRQIIFFVALEETLGFEVKSVNFRRGDDA